MQRIESVASFQSPPPSEHAYRTLTTVRLGETAYSASNSQFCGSAKTLGMTYLAEPGRRRRRPNRPSFSTAPAPTATANQVYPWLRPNRWINRRPGSTPNDKMIFDIRSIGARHRRPFTQSIKLQRFSCSFHLKSRKGFIGLIDFLLRTFLHPSLE